MQTTPIEGGDRLRRIALIAAQTAALECSDSREEFQRINLAVLSGLEIAFPDLFAHNESEEVHQ
jgi:hypothetical protein